MNSLQKIDGSILEGGGQILRTALTCSSIFNITLEIDNIRGGRKKPGLQNQHLTGVNLLADICDANVSGNSIQSLTLHFKPKTINSGNFERDTKTAGSISLLIQSLVPTLLFAKGASVLTLTGGTDVDFAPPFDYYKNIVEFYMKKMGIDISIDLIKRGFYPRGGGTVQVELEPIKSSIKPITIVDQGEITNLKAICFVAGTLPVRIGHDMKDAIIHEIRSCPKYRGIHVNPNVFVEKPNKSMGNGSSCLLIAETSTGCRFGFSIVGSREYSGSQMGTKVAKQFIDFFDNSKGCVDSQMQDQILIFMALAEGQSRIRCNELTLHSRTCIYILEKMIGVKFLIEENVEGTSDVFIQCEGLGVNNTNICF